MAQAWQLGYTGGDLTSVTSPVAQTWTAHLDGVGRPLWVSDPAGT